MKKMNKKLFHAFMTLLLIVSVFIPLLKTSYTVKAEELPSNSYTMTTSPTINNNRLVDGAKYGEGKFYLNPTYKFDNSATLKNGDFMVYKVPKEFKVERDITTDIYAKDGATKIAELQTNAATNSATVTITNEEYFKNLTEDRELTALFTVVWADDVELNKEYSIDIPGAGTYRLTRIVPDDDPNYVNWRIRINRYVKPVTGVKIEDTIPEGQVLASEITGYYFTEWNKAEARPRLDASHVNVTGTNSFTVTPNGNGDLSTQGLYVLYRTRLTAPVDNTTKKAFNNVKVTTSDGVYDVDGFAPLTTTEGIGSGARPSEVEFEVTKQLNGGTLKGDEFIFQLIDPDGKVVETAKNNKDGQVKFKAIKFSKAGTFKYQIKEVDEKEPGYVYDNKTINAEVTVTDVFGEKFASVKYDNKVFVNSYSAKPTTATIEAIKVLKGRALEADKYEFELKEGDTVVGTAKNKADGSVVFPAIEYTAAGPHTYTITEKAGNEPGVTYDTASHKVTVDVADNGRGQLEATVPADKPVFTNTYTKPAPAADTITIEATKTLVGKELEAGKYEFELKEGDKVIGTATNAADGKVVFPSITYTEAGKHTYTVAEKAGNEENVTYDTTVHTVTVEVTDNGQGKLVSTITGNKPAFVNKYTAPTPPPTPNPQQPTPATATIQANKVLTGKELKDGQFEFELTYQGNVVDTAKNKADGSVTFKAQSFTSPGKYEYTITEKVGNEAGVTYDKAVHKVTVEVAYDTNGKLVATVTGNGPTFTNTYAAKTPPTSSEEKPKPSGDKHEDPKKEEPKKEVKKELPKTGTAESSAFSVLVGFLLLAASVFLYRTKKVN